MSFDAQVDFDIQFPPLPVTVAEVSAMLAEPSEAPPVARLIAVAEADPVVAAAVLRRCNSAFYGLRRRVGSVRRAVLLLGFREVTNLVIAAGLLQLRRLLQTEGQLRLFEQVMRLSLGTAAYGAEIAVHLHLPQERAAFTAGLLHSVGRLVFLYNQPGAYEALWYEQGAALTPSVSAERVRFGTDHAELGGLAAAYWQLPAFFKGVIQHYPTPDRLPDAEQRETALVVAVAAVATERLYSGHVHPPTAALRPLTAQHKLAHAAGIPVAELEKLLADRCEHIYAYVEAMVGGEAVAVR